MVTMGVSQAILSGPAFTTGLDKHHEQLLNLLCEIRQDARFEEWCRLARALGLGGLTLRALADLHEGAAEALIPELLGGESLRATDFGVLPDALLSGPDGTKDNVSSRPELPRSALSHAQLPTLPNAELVVPLPAMSNGTYDRRGSAAAS